MWNSPRPRRSPTRASLLRLRSQLDGLDHAGLERAVAPIGGLGLDRVDGLHPVDHLAEDGVLAVEPGRRVLRDEEELASVRVRTRVRHRERAPDDLVLV